jgi:O-antigen ligase
MTQPPSEEVPALGPSGRAFILGAGALLVLRMCFPAHAPSLFDTHAALTAVALAFVAAAARPALLAGALVMTGAVLSIPLSWDPWLSFLALPAVLGTVGFFLLASTGSNKTVLLAAAGIGGAINAVAAVVQKTITWPSKLAELQASGIASPADIAMLSHGRPIGMSLSPDLAGGMCIAGAFCAFALALDTQDKRARTALLALSAVSASSLVVVRSFGSALALVAGDVGVALLWSASSKRAALAGGALGVVAFAVAVVTRGVDAITTSAGERIANWRTAVDVFFDAPVFGVGLMRFGAAYLEHRPPDANITRYAHSGPLQILAETGLVGGALALAALVVVVRVLWARRATLTASDRVLVGAAAAVGVRACIDYDLHVAQSASVAAVVVGLLLARADPAPAERTQRRALAVGAVVALVLVVVLGWREGALESEDDAAIAAYVDKVPVDAEPRIALAARAVDALVICTADDGCAAARTQVFALLDPLCERRHPSAVALVLRARAKIAAGHLQAALADIDQALTVDPGNAAAHKDGVMLANTLRTPDAVERAERARTWGVDASLSSQIMF